MPTPSAPSAFEAANLAVLSMAARACYAQELADLPSVGRLIITVEQHDGLTVVEYEIQDRVSGFPVGGMSL
jgi:hypothetical protein